MTATSCLHTDCEVVVDDDDLMCRPHTLAVQLIGGGMPAEQAHALAALDGTPVTTRTTDLLEDVDGDPAGVCTTTTTGDVLVIVPALFARHYQRNGDRPHE